MAKINVVGDAVVVTSELKYPDIERIKKYRPEALTLYGGEDGKEPVFCIGLTSRSRGCLNAIGAEFGGMSHDGSEKATITMIPTIPAGADIKEVIADTFGAGIALLERMEAKLPEVLNAINTERDTIMSHIEVA